MATPVDPAAVPAAPVAPAPAAPAEPAAPAAPPEPAAPAADATDWKAAARKWETRAKENKTAADELATLKAAQMSEQEKAVQAATEQGRTAALAEAAPQIAQARLEAAAALKGVDLTPFAEFLDVGKFVKNGEVDGDAITAAVDKLAALAPRGPGRSGGDMGGAGGSGDTATSLDKQIAQAKADGNWREVMRLENSKLAAAEAAIQQ